MYSGRRCERDFITKRELFRFQFGRLAGKLGAQGALAPPRGGTVVISVSTREREESGTMGDGGVVKMRDRVI